MVEFDVEINRKQQVAYISKVLTRSLGYRLKLIPNTRTAVLFAEGQPLADVIDSLDIIRRGLAKQLESQRDSQREVHKWVPTRQPDEPHATRGD